MGIALMNLFTAVIVNSALEQANQDKELMKAYEDMKRKKLIKEAKHIFKRIDQDGSGTLSREEILNVEGDDKGVLSQLSATNDLGELFDALDVDGSGDLNINEFIDG